MTDDLTCSFCYPIIDDNDNAISIVSYDTIQTGIKVKSREKNNVMSFIGNHSHELYRSMPEIFRHIWEA